MSGILRVVVPMIAALPLVVGAEVSWTGDSGTWQRAAAWSGGSVPAAADQVVIGDVAQGKRTITIDQPATIAGLSMSQQGAGSNALVLAADLVIVPAQRAAPLTLERKAGTLSIDCGKHRLALRGAHLGTVTLPGTVTLGPGSLLLVDIDAERGGAELVNSGIIDQRGGVLRYHWRAAKPHYEQRKLVNRAGATWTIAAGGRVEAVVGPADDATETSTLTELRNDGDLRLDGGVVLPVYTLDNAGTLVLGDAAIGHAIQYGSAKLHNHGSGSITVTGEALVGGKDLFFDVARVDNGDQDLPGARLRIGADGKPARLTLRRANTTMTNAAGCSVEIASGSALKLWGAGRDHHPCQTTIINWGSWLQRGRIEVQPNAQPGTTSGVNNKGEFQISGPECVFERLGNVHYDEDCRAMFANHTTGVLTGDGTLTYVNSTGKPRSGALLVQNSGRIAPGTAKQPGTLTLVNADVSFSDAGTGTLAIRVFSTKPDGCDRLVLSGEQGGSFALSDEGAALSVTLAPGFAATSPAQWRVVTAKQVVGGFSASELPKGFSVASDATGIVLSYAP
ncbi:MAG: hypothetical protein H0W72_03565 [Planctomycetes bacterium]|nr:hypothetical protein [Planctomycetota bacterium]